MELYEHQRKILNDDRKWTGIWHGTGSGKSRTALEIGEGKTLIIVPKQQYEERSWQKNAEAFKIGLSFTVISKETFRRDSELLGYFDTVIVDECHYFTSGLYPDVVSRNRKSVPKTSQLYKSLFQYIRKHNPKRFYLLSATPASKPMAVLAIAWLFCIKWDFFKFRARYYIEKKKGYRTIWIPRQDKKTKEELASYLKQFGYTGKLSDWFDVPEQVSKTIYVGLTKEQKEAILRVEEEDADPMGKRARIRTIENGCLYSMSVSVDGRIHSIGKKTEIIESSKLEHIGSLVEELPKVLIFANFLGQIEQIRMFLEERGVRVFVLTGATKDRKKLIEDAEACEGGVVIAQAGVSSGYELKTYRCAIFASLSPKVLDEIQGRGRILRADALHKNLYVYLVVRGGLDEQCYKSIMNGVDFNEMIYE